ncbi:hypothetical protein CTI12_AA276200 [Artemisia annua]|uniref:Gag-polypeptide of LTR copia-type n=1 Tax=Artemisia annua TaxID=35608 RepID=A0A2U1NDW8_ARTAN|nr:hypothetical protein CTI12_AA276200 [Artemisia annua]
MASNIVQLNAPTHFPIKLTSSNFPVWRKQIQSTLIGLDLLQYIDGTLATPSQFSGNERKTINPAYTRWYRQDQTLLCAILGSCSDMIQPIISSATSSKEAWDRLLHSYANASRSRIISLKSKLAKNPKGNKSVAEFLNEMRSIADELALIQNPISEDDLVVHIITQLEDEFNSLVAAIKSVAYILKNKYKSMVPRKRLFTFPRVDSMQAELQLHEEVVSNSPPASKCLCIQKSSSKKKWNNEPAMSSPPAW